MNFSWSIQNPAASFCAALQVAVGCWVWICSVLCHCWGHFSWVFLFFFSFSSILIIK